MHTKHEAIGACASLTCTQSIKPANTGHSLPSDATHPWHTVSILLNQQQVASPTTAPHGTPWLAHCQRQRQCTEASCSAHTRVHCKCEQHTVHSLDAYTVAQCQRPHSTHRKGMHCSSSSLCAWKTCSAQGKGSLCSPLQNRQKASLSRQATTTVDNLHKAGSHGSKLFWGRLQGQ